MTEKKIREFWIYKGNYGFSEDLNEWINDPDIISVADTIENGIHVIEYSGYEAERAKSDNLYKLVNGFLALIEEGILVRDTSNDYDTAKYLKQGVRLITHLAVAQSAVAKMDEDEAHQE